MNTQADTHKVLDRNVSVCFKQFMEPVYLAELCRAEELLKTVRLGTMGLDTKTSRRGQRVFTLKQAEVRKRRETVLTIVACSTQIECICFLCAVSARFSFCCYIQKRGGLPWFGIVVCDIFAASSFYPLSFAYNSWITLSLVLVLWLGAGKFQISNENLNFLFAGGSNSDFIFLSGTREEDPAADGENLKDY